MALIYMGDQIYDTGTWGNDFNPVSVDSLYKAPTGFTGNLSGYGGTSLTTQDLKNAITAAFARNNDMERPGEVNPQSVVNNIYSKFLEDYVTPFRNPYDGKVYQGKVAAQPYMPRGDSSFGSNFSDFVSSAGKTLGDVNTWNDMADATARFAGSEAVINPVTLAAATGGAGAAAGGGAMGAAAAGGVAAGGAAAREYNKDTSLEGDLGKVGLAGAAGAVSGYYANPTNPSAETAYTNTLGNGAGTTNSSYYDSVLGTSSSANAGTGQNNLYSPDRINSFDQADFDASTANYDLQNSINDAQHGTVQLDNGQTYNTATGEVTQPGMTYNVNNGPTNDLGIDNRSNFTTTTGEGSSYMPAHGTGGMNAGGLTGATPTLDGAVQTAAGAGAVGAGAAGGAAVGAGAAAGTAGLLSLNNLAGAGLLYGAIQGNKSAQETAAASQAQASNIYGAITSNNDYYNKLLRQSYDNPMGYLGSAEGQALSRNAYNSTMNQASAAGLRLNPVQTQMSLNDALFKNSDTYRNTLNKQRMDYSGALNANRQATDAANYANQTQTGLYGTAANMLGNTDWSKLGNSVSSGANSLSNWFSQSNNG